MKNESPTATSSPMSREEIEKWIATATWAFENTRAATLDGIELRRLCDMALNGLAASETGTPAEVESCIGELRQIADSGAMIHLLGWDDIQRTCEQAAQLLQSRPSATRRTELGCAGHLIVANRCRWKRHTQVGNYRVSTIGDYYPDGENGKRDTIGAGKDSLFETMVFKTTDEQDKENEGCGCHAVKEWSELECERYATAGEAQAGHERYVSKYQEMK